MEDVRFSDAYRRGPAILNIFRKHNHFQGKGDLSPWMFLVLFLGDALAERPDIGAKYLKDRMLLHSGAVKILVIDHPIPGPPLSDRVVCTVDSAGQDREYEKKAWQYQGHAVAHLGMPVELLRLGRILQLRFLLVGKKIKIADHFGFPSSNAWSFGTFSSTAFHRDPFSGDHFTHLPNAEAAVHGRIQGLLQAVIYSYLSTIKPVFTLTAWALIFA